jgi:REP element-mobilizing transposase RayT
LAGFSTAGGLPGRLRLSNEEAAASRNEFEVAAASDIRHFATPGLFETTNFEGVSCGTRFAIKADMTLPRDIQPGRVYMVSRRSTQRQFLLRPDELTNLIFLYALIYAARRFNIGIITVTTMSNHYHAIVYDPDAQLPRFLELFHALTARALNIHRDRWENFWAAEQPNFNYCVEQGDVLDKTVYALANPVSAHLVDKVANWPGVSSMNWLDGRTITVKRPDLFFTNKMPESLSFQLMVPPHFEGDRAQWADQVRAHVDDAEKAAATKRATAGIRVVGRKKVLATSPFDRPDSREPRGQLRPLIAAKNPRARIGALAALKEFRRLYYKARKVFRAGLRAVLFPIGTFWLVHYCGVSVSPS